MFKWIRERKLTKKFKEFVGFNSYTAQAMKLETDEQLKEHCLKCIDKIAKDNKKEIKSVSLEDIYRVLSKVRKKTPKLLRQITLSQIEKTMKSAGSMSNTYQFIYSIANLTPVPLIFMPIKKIFGRRVKFVIVTWVVSLVAKEIYNNK